MVAISNSRPAIGVAFSGVVVLVCLCAMVFINESPLQRAPDLDRSVFFLDDVINPRRMLADQAVPSPGTSPELRLLIGILTLPDLYERRNLLRLVYGIQTPAGAQVDVKFIFCNLTKEDQTILVALEILHFDDIIILNCTENMNNGKTYTYFSSLPALMADTADGHRRPPYDYVMKADDDIYFRLDPLVSSFKPLPREDVYYGFVIPCEEMNPFDHYMSGMGYALSWDLVDWISKSELAKMEMIGPEDLQLGHWLNAAGLGKNRHNTKPAMYDYPIKPPLDSCSHDFIPETIAVHRLKDDGKWVDTIKYFNVTSHLKNTKFYHIF